LVSLVFIFLFIGFISIRSNIFFSFIVKILRRIPKINCFVNDISESYNGFHSLTRSRITIQSWLLSMIAWSIDAIVIYIVFLSFGLELNIIFTTLIIHSSFLLGNISIIPAGLGITELSAVGFLLQEGIQLSVATSLVIIIRLVTTWFATIVGLISTQIYLKEK